jgi:hypothetical protein
MENIAIKTKRITIIDKIDLNKNISMKPPTLMNYTIEKRKK